MNPSNAPGPPPAPLQVVFALYDRSGSYWLNTAVAISSLARHAKGAIRIDILHDETLGQRAKDRLAQIARALGLPLTLRPVSLPQGLEAIHLKAFSPAALFRLFIPRLYAGHELVVYLDSDLVMNGIDLCEIAGEAAPDKPVSAVVDTFMTRAPSHRVALEQLGLDGSTYFNSGVMVFRPRLIGADLMAGFTAFAAANPVLLHPDQDYLNTVFAGQVHFLPDRFNTQIGLLDYRLVQPLNWYYGRVLHYQLKPLKGQLSPALIPFFAHAMLVPEIYSGVFYEPKAYLVPTEGRDDQMRVVPVR